MNNFVHIQRYSLVICIEIYFLFPVYRALFSFYHEICFHVFIEFFYFQRYDKNQCARCGQCEYKELEEKEFNFE